jgi:hypothetical protein
LEIREFYKYTFILDENEIFMKLTLAANQNQFYMVHLKHRNEIVPQIQPKYNQKLDIKTEKTKDIYSMRGYCNILTESELNYWYLLPNKD